jgi:hypothetical protein
LPERLARRIHDRENILNDCAAALDGLRVYIEETNSPAADEPPPDARILEELRRLAAPLRRVRVSRILFLAVWGGLMILYALPGDLLPGAWVLDSPRLGTALAFAFLAYLLTFPLQRRLYS